MSRYVKDKGLDIFGLDLSEGMLKNARKRNPDITFIEGNMLDFSLKNNSLAGIILNYSIVNFTIEEVEKILANIWRILEDEGMLFIAFHAGDEVIHIDNLLEEEVQMDFTFFDTDEIVGILEKLKYRIIEKYEYISKKGYIICQKVYKPIQAKPENL